MYNKFSDAGRQTKIRACTLLGRVALQIIQVLTKAGRTEGVIHRLRLFAAAFLMPDLLNLTLVLKPGIRFLIPITLMSPLPSRIIFISAEKKLQPNAYKDYQ